MYEAYWKLETRPFENTSDPRFYYPSEAHQGAMLKLRYVVESRRGAALLAGAPGLGKTLITQTLLSKLPDRFTPKIHLVFPQMPSDQLLAYLAEQLDGGRPVAAQQGVARNVRRIENAIVRGAENGRHAVLVIDEAHLLAAAGAMETLRLLLNFQFRGEPCLTLLIVGQPPLLPALERMPGLEERLGVKCLLRPFSMEETLSYISHRLTASGASGPIFEQEAMETVHQLTHGVPRRINRLCDLSLLIGFAEERQTIGSSQIEAVCDELVTVAPE